MKLGIGAIKKIGSQGFSLIDLLIVIAIIGTLAVISAPMSLSLMSKYEAQESASLTYNAFKLCKSEAIKRLSEVHCSFELTDQNSVTNIIYLNNDTQPNYNEEIDTLLYIYILENIHSIKTSLANLTFSYNARGTTSNGTTQAIKICSSKSSNTYSIKINPQGMVSLNQTEINEVLGGVCT